MILKDLGNQISSLWERLQISENVQEEFFERVKGISTEAIEAVGEDILVFEITRQN